MYVTFEIFHKWLKHWKIACPKVKYYFGVFYFSLHIDGESTWEQHRDKGWSWVDPHPPYQTLGSPLIPEVGPPVSISPMPPLWDGEERDSRDLRAPSAPLPVFNFLLWCLHYPLPSTSPPVSGVRSWKRCFAVPLQHFEKFQPGIAHRCVCVHWQKHFFYKAFPSVLHLEMVTSLSTTYGWFMHSLFSVKNSQRFKHA